MSEKETHILEQEYSNANNRIQQVNVYLAVIVLIFFWAIENSNVLWLIIAGISIVIGVYYVWKKVNESEKAHAEIIRLLKKKV